MLILGTILLFYQAKFVIFFLLIRQTYFILQFMLFRAKYRSSLNCCGFSMFIYR